MLCDVKSKAATLFKFSPYFHDLYLLDRKVHMSMENATIHDTYLSYLAYLR